MRCPKCQVDVATEVSADGQSLKCTTCGSEVKKVIAPSLHPDMAKARNLVERLSRDSAQPQDAEPSPNDPEPQSTDANAAEPARMSYRIDRPHSTDELAGRTQRPARKHEQPAKAAEQSTRRDHAAHASLPAPHFDVSTIAMKKHPGRGESMWGQLLAYLGVGVLTVGTAVILWGYFGGPAEYAPTGWLVTTAGQMLLLLGVITLVSGGLQQTKHEVGTRVEFLNGRMHRIEQTAEKLLQGPHFGRAAGQNKTTTADAASRRAADEK
ncbi:MAG: hypothetical protein DWQ34_23295 [Planctomycetota bacterium]|nr:MAG: hypothetical protein DWQ29_16970 [Planctomycetota bacterium]REJ88056.1 MAG: hypothetical protein DWQ34_23295 [Planctomycetota bacterium]REK24197.1 MAG: hypothetical protein DWQ41_14255 [Planctomycetota bacterium]REK28815.1 MAG: hypothetical protein DWQ45_24260 [Planctomycetota bacterium]